LLGLLGAFGSTPGCGSDPARDTADAEDGGASGAPGTGGALSSAGRDSSSDGGTAGRAGAGSHDAGSGGLGGGGADPSQDTTSPEVVTIAPEDGAEDVPRETAIVVTLSEPIDPTSAGAALAVVGPTGAIPGELRVEEHVVTFMPDAPLLLLGEYIVTLEGVADWSGNRQAEPVTARFRARDGSFGEPAYPFGDEASHAIHVAAGNHGGDFIVAGADRSAPPRAWASVYRLETDDFTPIELLNETGALPAYARGAALNEQGSGAVLWWLGSPSAPSGWSGYTPTLGFEDAGKLTDSFAALTAVSEDGRAMAVTQSVSRFVYSTLVNLKSGSADATFERGDADETLHRLLGVDQDFMLIATRAIDGAFELTAARHRPREGWQEPEVVSASSIEALDVLALGDEAFNVAILWSEGDELWSRFYAHADGAWRDAERVTREPSARWRSLAFSQGRAVACFSSISGLSIAYYDLETGWLHDGLLAVGSSASGAVAIDPRGNALAIWSETGDYRRYVTGRGWQPPETLALELHDGHFAAFAAKDGRVTVVTSDKRLGGELPVAIRFE
jgi:hypothetical protein